MNSGERGNPEHSDMPGVQVSRRRVVDLSKIGINLSIKNVELGALLDALHSRQFQMYLLSETCANMEPITLLSALAAVTTRIGLVATLSLRQ